MKPDDNRVQFLSLTPTGKRVLPDLAAIADHRDRQFFGCPSPQERATLKRLLRKLTYTLQFSDVPID
ncbi:MAG: MarR family winged helix-turn-helix transcriptional regulator [Candidatus Acidiferrum sp.]